MNLRTDIPLGKWDYSNQNLKNVFIVPPGGFSSCCSIIKVCFDFKSIERFRIAFNFSSLINNFPQSGCVSVHFGGRGVFFYSSIPFFLRSASTKEPTGLNEDCGNKSSGGVGARCFLPFWTCLILVQ